MNWIIEEKGFDVGKTPNSGNKFLLGNGYMGVRGTLEEFDKSQLAAVNLAGIYDRVGEGWREPLNAPNGLFTRLTIDGAACGLPQEAEKADNTVEHCISLDFRKALLSRKTVWITARGAVTVRSERLVSLADCHLIAMKYSVSADYPAEIELSSGIDSDVWDINGPHYEKMVLAEEDGYLSAVGTAHESGDNVAVVEGCRTSFICWEQVRVDEKRIMHQYSFAAEPGRTYEITKWIAVFTSKDAKDYLQQAKQLVRDEIVSGYETVKKLHIRKWEEKWAVSEVLIDGDDDAMEALNYSLYHLHSIAPRHSDSLSIPARGLSGQTYKGAVFWDTDMFMLDFFLYTEPSVARTLTRYRIDTLEGARKKADSYGYEGAFYAWESQEGGYDACSDYNVTDVFTGRPMRTYFKDKQIHISAAVVHGIMRYTEMTGDQKILEEGGARTIIECAIFYCSLLIQKMHGDFYELHDVIGPDEYHERVNNNGYTNRMAKYTFDCAVRVLDMVKDFPETVKKQIQEEYSLDELETRFKEASSRLFLPAPGGDGVISQFDGYMDLEDASIEAVRARLLHEKEYWGGAYGVAAHTKVIKQADVVAWLALFPEDYAVDILRKNWNYYEPRTEHGSSLSNCMYALLACRCAMAEKAYPFFLKSAHADIDEGGKQWAGLIYIGGTHPAAAGGAYMTAVNGFGGIYVEDGVLKASPQLPSTWTRLQFKVWHHGELYQVDAAGNRADVMKCR